MRRSAYWLLDASELRPPWAMWLALLGAGLVAAPLSGQRVEGRTTDAEGRTVSAVAIQLLDGDARVLLGVESDSLGQFVLPLPRAGSFRLRTEALGYATSVTDPIEVTRDEAVVVEIRMSVEALPITPLVVTARRQDVHRAHRDFYRRKTRVEQTGFGRTLDREALEKTFLLSHRLVEIPGLRWAYDNDGELRLGKRGCPGGVYLNGMFVGNPAPDELVFPTDLEGVEVYRNEAEVPPELVGGGGVPLCTVLALWTRSGITGASDRSHWMRMGLFGALIGGFVLYVTTN